MYTIHADGQLLFDSLSEKPEDIALSPKLSLDVNKAGSLSFVLPPGNRMHGSLKKLKSVLTVEQGGAQIARGRVMETEGDFYNQQNVYCEGDKSFLLDSIYEPGSLSGKVRDFFRELISNHNEQVDAEKRFTVGIVDAVDANLDMQADSRTETRVYWNTLDMIEDSLLNVYGGYLRTRKEGNTHYIDWVSQYGDLNAQPIEFSVNMLDLTDKVDASEVFTVLIPLGASEIGEDGEYTDPLTIATVNGGLNYIQDDAAVATYGKIWRTKTWSYIEDPAQLLAKGREYLKTGIAFETLTLKAVDMHFTNGNVQPIRLGDKVRILSNPHGLDKVMTCTQMEIDLVNPENTVYTFGEKPRTLTENFVKAEEEVEVLTGRGGGSGGRSVKEEISNIRRWADILADEERGIIALLAGEEFKDIDSGKVLSLKEANLILNGAEGKAGLIARVEDQEGRISSAELILNGDEATAGLITRFNEAETAITLKVDKETLIREINLSADNVIIDAAKVDLSGYLTTSIFSSKMAKIDNIFAGYSEISALGISGNLYAANARFTDNVSLLERVCNWTTVTMGDVVEHTLLGAGTNKTLDLAHSHAVTVNDDGTITLGEVSSSGGTFKIADTAYYKNGVSASYNKGKTDWSPVAIQRTGYSTADKTVTTRAVNAAGVPLIALEDIDASEIFNAGAESVVDEVVIGCDQPSKIIHIGNNVYQMTVRIWAKYNGDTIQATTVTLSKGLYN